MINRKSSHKAAQLVYLDTAPALDSVAVIDTFPSQARRYVEQQVKELGDGSRFPMPPRDELANFGSLEGLDDNHTNRHQRLSLVPPVVSIRLLSIRSASRWSCLTRSRETLSSPLSSARVAGSCSSRP
jgi:hypothetical protein